MLPDPKDGNILYGTTAANPGRCDQFLNTPAPLGGQLPPADPNDPNRKTWTLPQVFSQADEALYFANQFVMRSRDRGRTWEKISPDLARLNPAVPATLDPLTAKDIDEPMADRFGVVYTIGPSPIEAHTVWVGTDDGLIHVTRDDGKTWNNVTPPAMTAWSKVSQIEASHFDGQTAYASVDRHRLADNKPYIYRTHDGGKTWQNVAAGIPEGAYVNSVKEDTEVQGLLFACTELRVYVSFNDGNQWQPLQNNMPVTSVRDVVVHGDDLDIATHGRGFWVLDQMTPLRQIAGQGSTIVTADAYLFKPGETFAIRNGGMNGTPLPHEEPQEENPPSGVVAYYWLKSAAAQSAEAGVVGWRGRGARLRRQRHAGAAGGYRNVERAGDLATAGAAAIRGGRDASLRPGRIGRTQRRVRWRVRRTRRQCRSAGGRLHGSRGGFRGGSSGRGAWRRPRWTRRGRRWRRARRRRRLAGRPVQRAADRRRQDLYPARRRETGSARRSEGRGGRRRRRIASANRLHAFRHPIRYGSGTEGEDSPGNRLDRGYRPGHRHGARQGGCGGNCERPHRGARGPRGPNERGRIRHRGRPGNRSGGTRGNRAVSLGGYSGEQSRDLRAQAVRRDSGRRLAPLLRGERAERGPHEPPLYRPHEAPELGADRVHFERVGAANSQGNDPLRHDQDRALAIARGLAETTAGTGVTVNSVLPGPTKSEGVLAFVEQACGSQWGG